MNIGDKVRMLHSSEEGIIIKLLDNNIIEVEIEDGFHIPVKKSEIVVISQEENRQFGKYKQAKEELKADKSDLKPTAQKGIFVAFIAINDKMYAYYLINNTDFDLPFQLGEEKNMNYKGLMAGVLKAKNSHKITELNIQEFENWSNYVFQFLFFSNGYHTLREAMTKKVRFRANTFFKSKGVAPVLNKEAYLMQIDQDEKILIAKIEPEIIAINPEKIKAEMFEKSNVLPDEPKIIIKKPAKEMDLHIENLSKDYEKMNSAEMIQLQLQVFEKSLENAIASGMNEIIFIHGVGNGKLRHEIHKRLSGNTDIQFFEDARREKFGYGATKVVFK